MITLRGVDVHAGARPLLLGITAHVSPGDRIGLVGRNGAGKTTLLGALAGALPPAAGTITRTGPVGYLPQDPAAADPAQTVTDRVLSARGLDDAVRALRAAEAGMASGEARALDRYARAEAEFTARGGYAAEAEAARIAAGLGLPDGLMRRPIGTLSGGQRRRAELARVLFGEDGVLLLDEPTNHLDADSVAWLRGFLASRASGLVVISHDTGLLAATVNRVWHLDPDTRSLDVHNTGWDTYLADRDAEDRRRARHRAAAERKAAALHAQADRMRARVSTATRAKDMARRADRMLAATEPVRRTARVARIRLPEPAPSGRTPLGAISLAKSYGDQVVLKGVDLAVDRGSRLVVLGLNGAGKTTLLKLLAGVERPDSGRVVHGHGLRLGYFAQEHDTLDPDASVAANLAAAAPHLAEAEARGILGSFLFSGDDVDKPAGVLSGGEKTRLALAGLVASSANVLLLDEPTNNLDPASRAEVLRAVAEYRGAIVMVTHDEAAVEALRPGRVLILPDATEDLWNPGYADLVTLA
ncbi:ABC-F family ATP-binding cassette domain-containing protein [Actinomadura harenae]|uniref:ABC transporter ATP-binding protein n=1 Tax=Actinomadura harenae TaxID=2483351 RepID=A0A3M2LPW8_9ACTN|nr:ABC-F family ATP-binding cassette domain-containing protein [Actinomadura harenae]RMI39489.1 ABC transporter ATP-binding protein [Actinomadura harenae]